MKLVFMFIILLSMISHCMAFDTYKKTLKSASELNYPPFSIVTHDDQADGFSVALLRSVTHAMGLNVKFHVAEWNEIKNDLKAGNLDVLPLVGRTPEREAYFDFTIPYLTMHGTVLVRKDDNTIKNQSDLSGKKLLVMSGDNAHEYLLRTKITDHIIETKSYSEALRKLSAGHYDGVVVQKLVGIQLIKELKLSNLHPVDFVLSDLRQDFCFAVEEGDKKLLALLNEGLSIVMANGVYAQHYNKWFSFLIEQDYQQQKIAQILIFITVILVFIIALSAVWQRTLKRRINDKTKALWESEQRLQNVIVGANLGFWDWSYQTGEHKVSKHWLEILGLESSDIKNNIADWSERVHMDDISRVNQVIENAIMQDTPYRVEFRMRHNDDSWKWIEGSGRVIERDSKTGMPIRLCGTHQDITERIQAELAQKKYYESLQLLLENINGISWELDLSDGTFVYVSPNAERILGYPLENWVNIDSWTSMILPEEQKYAAAFCHAEVNAGRDHNFEYRMRKKNGEIIWVLDIVTVIKDNTNKPIKLAGFILDNSERKKVEKAIRQSESDQRAILSAIPDLMFVLDADGQYINVWTNEPQKLAVSEKSLPGKTVFEMLDANSSEQVMAALKEADEKGHSSGQIINIITPDGDNLWFELSTSIKDRETVPHQFIMLSRDVTKRIQNEDKLKLAASVFAHAREGIMIADLKGNLIEVNNAFTKITGYSRAEVLGENPRFLKSGRQEPEFYTNMWRKLIEKGSWTGEIWNKHKNAEIFAEQMTINSVQNEDNEVQYYIALFTDITEQKYQQQRLEHMAHFDALTLLPNRLLLTDRLHQALLQAQRRNYIVSIAFLDLDGFKAINDKYGHSVGDQLLTTLSSRMQHVLREGDTIARLGGDEFVVVLNDLIDTEAGIPWLTRLLKIAAEPVNINCLTISVSASIGVTFFPQNEEVEGDQLLRQADQAMYQAKLKGKNRYHIFDADEDRNVRGHHEDLKHITQALRNNEFVLYYQPKVNMRSGKVIGTEALIRWQHPEKGLLSPYHFLPLIENNLLSVDVGDWVIDSALCQMQEWHDAGLDLEMSINISALQLQQPDFLDLLFERLADSPDIKPDNLVLEVLETSALEDIFLVSQVIRACSEKGIKFALDDFGTGYSSLTYLKRLPVTQLKIDQTFVFDMLDDPENLAILEGILGLGKAFHHQIIAEGVETIEHGEMLLHLGAELAQGYAIAHPLPAADVQPWIQTWQPDPLWSNSRTISRGDLPLLFASAEHRAWVRSLEEWFNGERTMPPTMNKYQCRFGQWLHNEGRARYGQTSVFEHIEILHEEVHFVASEVCQFKTKGQLKDARIKLSELHIIKDQLIEYLKQLIR